MQIEMITPLRTSSSSMARRSTVEVMVYREVNRSVYK
jgi:hypothetical protein